MEIKALGNHILIEYFNCNGEILKDNKKIEKLMNEAAKEADATIVNSIFHEFNPYGVSGAIIIAESHLTIHTWPEYNYASVDIYTCGDKVKNWKAFDYLEKKLESTRSESTEIPRGMTSKIEKFEE